MTAGPDITHNIREAEKKRDAAWDRLKNAETLPPSEQRDRLCREARSDFQRYASDVRHWQNYLPGARPPAAEPEKEPSPEEDRRLPRESE